jgi:hypothetical protein
MKERAKIKEQEVRQIIQETIASSNLVHKMELVDTLQHIGVDYHYKKEIDEILCSVYYDKDGGSEDLYITSLRFYLLRKHGYRISSGNIRQTSKTFYSFKLAIRFSLIDADAKYVCWLN